MIVAPQLRLCLEAGKSVQTSDVVLSSTIHLEPHMGAWAPIMVGGNVTMMQLGAKSLTLDPDPTHLDFHEAEKMFDIYVDSISGDLCSVPWGTSYLVRDPAVDLEVLPDGVEVNLNGVAARSGAAPGDIINAAPRQLFYQGTFSTVADGVCAMELRKPSPGNEGGSNTKLYLWNRWQTKSTIGICFHATQSWQILTNVPELMNPLGPGGGTRNRITFIDGRGHSQSEAQFSLTTSPVGNNMTAVTYGLQFDYMTGTPLVGRGSTSQQAWSGLTSSPPIVIDAPHFGLTAPVYNWNCAVQGKHWWQNVTKGSKDPNGNVVPVWAMGNRYSHSQVRLDM